MKEVHADAWRVNGDDRPSKGVHKFELLAAAACDETLTRADVAVLAVILRHHNADKGEAWPGINRIADQAKLHRSNVLRAVARLEAAGWVQVKRPERGKSNRYCPIFKSSSASATGVVAPARLEVVAPARPEHRNKQHRNEHRPMSRAKSALDSRFADFWSIYPKRVAKQFAEKAFRKLKPDEIEAALADVKRRAASEWEGKDPQYIPNPATYLNGRRWNDEPQSGKPGTNFKTATYDVPDYLAGAI